MPPIYRRDNTIVYKDDKIVKKVMKISNDNEIYNHAIREAFFYGTFHGINKHILSAESVELNKNDEVVITLPAMKYSLDDYILLTPFFERRDQFWTIFTGLAEGLAVLHRYINIHGDIKPANIFINSPTDVKIGDFGTCCFSVVPWAAGTYDYVPPYSNINHSSSKHDVWSLGLTMLEFITGQNPITNLYIDNMSTERYLEIIYDYVKRNNGINVADELEDIDDPEIFSILSQCLVMDENKRISSNDLYSLCCKHLHMEKIKIPLVTMETKAIPDHYYDEISRGMLYVTDLYEIVIRNIKDSYDENDDHEDVLNIVNCFLDNNVIYTESFISLLKRINFQLAYVENFK